MSPKNGLVPNLVDSTELGQYSPARVELSSKDKGWKGLLLTRYIYANRRVDSSPRPATQDHAMLLVDAGEQQGEYTYNHSRWRPYSMRKGDWAIGQAYENHFDWRGEAVSGHDNEVATITIHLSPKLLSQVATEVVGIDGNRIELLHQTNIRDPLISQLAVAIKAEIRRDGLYGQLFAETISLVLAAHLLKNYCTQHYRIQEIKGKLLAKRLRPVLDYIHAHLHQEITIDVMARLAYLSPYYFARVFKKSTGETPYQFILRERMEKAMYLLRNTDKLVTQIAADVGYSYLSNFSSAFKQSTGMTPTYYCKNVYARRRQGV